MSYGIPLPPRQILNADGPPPSGHSELFSGRPNRAFSSLVPRLGILAIVVLSRRFRDSFLSVTWGRAEGFGSLSCISL